MKNRTVRTIVTLASMACIAVVAYQLGTRQADTVTVTEVKTVEVIPDDYISLDECIPLEDVAGYFIDEYDYPCFELKDVGYQLDDSENASYAEIMETLDLIEY